MNFLLQCQNLVEEAGISGPGFTSVVGNTAGSEYERVVNWILREHRKVQVRHPHWLWLRKPFTFNTIASTSEYAYGVVTDVDAAAFITRFFRWYPHQFKLCLTSSGVAGENWLSYDDWESFKQDYRIGTQNTGYPSAVTVMPSGKIALGQTPDAVYTVTGEYQRGPQVLTVDATEPEMPEPFHDLIWLGAMRRYAAYEGDAGIWGEFKSQHSELMRALEADQLPEPGFAPPLA